MSATRPLDVSLTLEGFIRETFLLFLIRFAQVKCEFEVDSEVESDSYSNDTEEDD